MKRRDFIRTVFLALPVLCFKPLSWSKELPPHDLGAEKAVLGGILIDNDTIDQVMDILSADDFYWKAHRFIFEGMIDNRKYWGFIDLITLNSCLKDKGLSEKCGGFDYLYSLAEGASASKGIIYHAKSVKDLSMGRKRKMGLVSKTSTPF